MLIIDPFGAIIHHTWAFLIQHSIRLRKVGYTIWYELTHKCLLNANLFGPFCTLVYVRHVWEETTKTLGKIIHWITIFSNFAGFDNLSCFISCYIPRFAQHWSFHIQHLPARSEKLSTASWINRKHILAIQSYSKPQVFFFLCFLKLLLIFGNFFTKMQSPIMA